MIFLNYDFMNNLESDKRKELIIQFVKANPFCSKDGIFTKGKISKSRNTWKIIEDAVKEDKLKTLFSKNGKIRYYVPTEDMIITDLLDAVITDLKYRLRQFSKKYGLEFLVEKYTECMDLRLKVLKSEFKHNKKLNLSDTEDIFRKILSFIHNGPYIQNPSEIQKHFKYIDWQISRDRYYLAHELHSNPRNYRRPFHAKPSHVRRGLDDLLSMKHDGRVTGMKKRHQDDHVKKLESKSDFESEEMYKRMYAEKDRTLYDYDEWTPNKLLTRDVNARLDEIKRDPSKSKNSRIERKSLRDFAAVISQIPITELLES